MASKLNATVRAMNFLSNTRQYKQEQPSKDFSEGQVLRFEIPKTRFLSKVFLRVDGVFTATHASKSSFTKRPFAMQKLLRQIRISVNGVHNCYAISGVGAGLYNKVNKFVVPSSDVFGCETIGNVVSSTGTENTVNYTLELPIQVNDKDPVGLLMLNNDQTNVTVEIDCGYFSDIMSDSDITISDTSIQITPVLELFSIPANEDFVPDYSIVKLVHEQIESVSSAGEMQIKMPTGLTYRKLMIYIASDANHTPITHSYLGNFQLCFQGADTPYSISAKQLAYENWKAYGGALPLGCYVFDFSSQGIANMGGSRDYIDTQNITDFTLKVNFKNISGSTNYVTLVSEKLAKLQR